MNALSVSVMGGTAKKTGKGRLDRFYHLAKEQGYRARSAFKLIQLSRKFNFLSGARSLIDLCGAPGGWSQVAAKTMPVGSKVICVDLAPIKPMKGVVTMQCDITTDTCRSLLRKELGKSGQVDVVLNDGAPNVGANWSKDAFTQAELTLAACKLAVDMLRPGGAFVTKVFRSADYAALLWVFHQFFNKVEATKPSASRDVSAEIFVVCQDFKAPREVDPKLLDPKHVFMFEEPEVLSADKKGASLNGLLREMFARKRKRDGYQEGDEFRVLKLSDWLATKQPAEALVAAHKIVIDVPEAIEHPATTNEIKALIGDLKVIGKGDYLAVMKWRAKLRKEEDEDDEKETQAGDEEDTTKTDDKKDPVDLDGELDSLLQKRRQEERRDLKRLREREKKASWRRKMNLGLTGAEEEPDLFNMSDLRALDDVDQVDGIVNGDQAIESGDEDLRIAQYEVIQDSDDEARVARMEADINADYERKLAKGKEGEGAVKNKSKGKRVTRRDEVTAAWAQEMTSFAADIDKRAEAEGGRLRGLAYMGSDSDDAGDSSSDEGTADQFMSKAPVALPPVEEQAPVAKRAKKSAPTASVALPVTREDTIKADRFFSNPIFSKSDIKELSDSELPQLPLCDKKVRKEKNKQKKMREALRGSKVNEEDAEAGNDFEVVPSNTTFTRPEDPEELAETLAYGHLMIHKKSRMQTIEAGYNRYTFDDPESLPEWFTSEEKNFTRPTIPLTKELSQQLRAKMKEINARPIRKVSEAVGRKRQRAAMKLDKIRKQASSLANAEDIGGGSKARAISKAIAKTARDDRRKTVFTVVSKQGAASKNVSGKDGGGKGAKVKVVDRRLKKDRRAAKRHAKRR